MIGAPVLWISLVFYYGLFIPHSWEIAAGLFISIPLIIILPPLIIAYYQRCKVSYVVTNLRLIRYESNRIKSNQLFSDQTDKLV